MTSYDFDRLSCVSGLKNWTQKLLLCANGLMQIPVGQATGRQAGRVRSVVCHSFIHSHRGGGGAIVTRLHIVGRRKKTRLRMRTNWASRCVILLKKRKEEEKIHRVFR